MADFGLKINRSAQIVFTASAAVDPSATFVFTAKTTPEGEAVISSTNITFIFGSSTGTVELSDADTAGLQPRAYLCEVQAVYSASENYVIAEGTFDATRALRM